jgi:hypothetical protein
MAKFCKGISGNRGGRPKVLGDVQELARLHAPSIIIELARLALKAKSETARIAAIRELLDRGYGRTRQSVEVSTPDGNPLQILFEEIDALSRRTDRCKQFSKEPP